jgi:hypothetical protein
MLRRIRGKVNRSLLDEDDHVTRKDVTVTTTLPKDADGLYVVYENVTDARKQPGYVNEVHVSARHEASRKIPFRLVRGAPPIESDGLKFHIEVASKKLAEDPSRAYAVPLGRLKSVDGVRARVDTARVVFRILADIDGPLAEDTDISLNLSYSVTPKVKRDRDDFRKHLMQKY